MFPIIKTIDDVLPHIEGRSEFSVLERAGFKIICYNFMSNETFKHEDPHVQSILRECRGIIFDERGKLVSRPFHKFFNLNQNEETQFGNISWRVIPFKVYAKEDGSMVRPVLVNGRINMLTKKGFSQVSEKATDFLHNKMKGSREFIEKLTIDIRYGFTPVFEYVGPENRIVLEYENESFIYLGTRENLTGKYRDFDYPNVSVPKIYDVDRFNMRKVIDTISKMKGIEGVVIRFYDGQMIKVKSEDYLEFHKVLDFRFNERSVAINIVDEIIDDIKSNVSENDRKLIEETEDMMAKIREGMIKEYEVSRVLREKYDSDKSFAISEDKWLTSLYFGVTNYGLETSFKKRVISATKTLETWSKFKERYL